jgi:penicillin-binding protein 1A
MQTLAEEATAEHMRDVVQPHMNNQIKATGKLYLGMSKEKANKKIDNSMRQTDRWRHMVKDGYTEEQIVKAFNTKVKMEIFTYKGVRDTMMTPRDSIIHHKSIMRPAMVAVDPNNGHVRAYIGGPDYRFFKYDGATQTKRQIGSTAKPFIYSYAIEVLGLTPCKPVQNNRTTIKFQGRNWSPKEAGGGGYDGTFHPLYWGLMKSRNNYSAWIMKQAKNPERVAEYIHRIGIRSYIEPVPALCLGSYDSNPFEMAGAYSTFVNQGVRIDPVFVTRIEDKQGNVLATFTPKATQVMPERVAHTVIEMMKKVITGGTGRRMMTQFGIGGKNMHIAAKTGTTNRNVDAWFMCATPNLVIGTWVGGEENTIRFLRSADGSRIALPITGKFLKKVYADGSLGVSRDDKFKFTTKAPKFNCKMPAAGVTTTNRVITKEDFAKSDFVPDEYINQEEDFF